MLCKYWEPIFAFNHKPKGAHWTIDPQLFVVLRSEKYDKFTHNNKSFHSLTESIMRVTRSYRAEVEVKKGKAMNKVIQERAVMPANLYYDTVFAKKYLENGRPGNLYRNYVPPLYSARLRDFKGNVLRRNAEKTPALCEERFP